MPWKSSKELFESTKDRLLWFRKEKLSYGVSYLDKATGGIRPIDLVLVGAPPGFGKTAFVTTLAMTNVLQGKKVHLIALEAYEGEIQDRIHYQLLADEFYNDPQRIPHVDFSFSNWQEGLLDFVEKKYQTKIENSFDKLELLKTFYSDKNFTLNDFISQAMLIEQETDLIIVDHIHYFDIEDQNENRGMKTLIKEIRNVQACIKKPVVVVAHLRKRDRKNQELVADMEEFHGSSDLTKIATQVITIGKGELKTPTASETYFRIAKNRWNGSVTFYTAKVLFNMKRNAYDEQMAIGKLVNGGKTWEKIEEKDLPKWAQNAHTRPQQSSPTYETKDCSQTQSLLKPEKGQSGF